jgi:competence protein ComFC
MRCLLCEKLSLKVICKECIHTRLTPKISRRSLACGLEVLSFYPFNEVDYLLKSKYDAIGSKIYHILADTAFRPFARNFEHPGKLLAAGIDDRVTKGYAHTAILTRALKTETIRPVYGKLLAQNEIRYAGKNLDFRLKNPKGFRYTGPKNGDIILVDDLITTGTTLCEAKTAAEAAGASVLFALTLADAKES